MDGRFARFEEGLEVITRLLHSDTPVDYSGTYFNLTEGILLPRPSRPGGPPILIGGNGLRRTLPLVARFADEWNAVYLTPDQFRELSTALDEMLRLQGRDPKQVRRSMMTGCVFGRDRAEIERKVEARTQGKRTAKELRQHGVIVGTPTDFPEQLAALEQAGVQRVMLQWLDQDDLAGIEAMAKAVIG